MRYTFETDEQYIDAWKHCMIVGIEFSHYQSERWVESDEFDEIDEQVFTNIKAGYLTNSGEEL